MIIAEREDQYWATRIKWDDMAGLIKTKWDEGYAITDMTYGDEVYYVLMEKGTGIVGQEYLWKKSFSQIFEEDRSRSDSRCISSFFSDGSSFCVVRSEFKQSIEQRWCQSKSFPKKDIAYYWNIGFAITAINWFKGYWLILFSKGITYGQKESWETTFTLKPQKLTKALNEESKIISSVCFGDGKWAISYARHPNVYSQQLYLGEKFPEDEITNLWNDNYDISKAAYANGQWFLTFINSYVETYDVQGRFDELYKAKKYEDAQLFFQERLSHSFQSPDPIILDYMRIFIKLKMYEEGIEEFEHYDHLFGGYPEAMQIGGELFSLAYRQNKSEEYLRKALRCFSNVSPSTAEVEKKIREIRSLLPDENESETRWKQKMARKEQAKRKSARESKYKKL